MHERHASTRSRHRDVEASATTRTVDRSKPVHRLPSRDRRAISNAQNDVVALVALDVLEILHEERLMAFAAEPLVDISGEASAPIENQFDPLRLRTGQGDDADALVDRASPHEVEHQVNHPLSLNLVRPAGSRIVSTIFKVDVTKPEGVV